MGPTTLQRDGPRATRNVGVPGSRFRDSPAPSQREPCKYSSPTGEIVAQSELALGTRNDEPLFAILPFRCILFDSRHGHPKASWFS